MALPCILAVDIGSSSVRASLYSETGIALPGRTSRVDRAFDSTTDGGSTLEPFGAFDQVVEVIDEIVDSLRGSDEFVTHVAMCAFWHSLIGVDAAGRPATEVLGWADTRSRNYTQELRERFDENVVHRRTGARFHSSFWPAKLCWLRNDHPDIWAQTVRWMSFTDYVGLRLFGKCVTSISMASATGIFDLSERCWDVRLSGELGVNDKLPELTTVDQQCLRLTRDFASRWLALADAEWFPAVGDGAADNIGSGCIGRHRAALMVGTSAALRTAFDGDAPNEIPSGLWCYRIDRKRVVTGGALSDGGNLYRWVQNTFRLPETAEAELARRPPGASGLTFMPFLHGERSTGYNEAARGSMMGLTSAHDSIDIMQAALESVAFRLAEILDEIDALGKVNDIYGSGGALRDSMVWTQIIADVLGRDIVMTEVAESSSRGAVLLALESVGRIDGIEYQPQASRVIKSRPEIQNLYKAAARPTPRSL